MKAKKVPSLLFYLPVALAVLLGCSLVLFRGILSRLHDNLGGPAVGNELAATMPDQDLLNACLLEAKRYCPDIDIDATNAIINGIVDSVSSRLAGDRDPRKAIEAINKHLFDELSLRATGRVDTSSLLPDRILRGGEGHCLGLSLIYAAVAQRLRLPVYARIVPNHLFLAYDDGEHAFNIETTARGAHLPDTHYYLCYLPGSGQPAASVYLRKLSNVEFVANFLTNLGACLEQKKDALRAHKRALALFPEFAEILCNAGNAHLALGEYAKAAECLDRALELDPTLWQIHGNLGDCYFDTAQYRKASDSYRRAIDLLLTSLTITANVGGLPAGADALELARRCLRDESTPAATFAGLGVLAFRQGEHGLADALFERALQLEPSNRDFHSFRAVLCVRLGDYAAARRHCLAANEGLPYSPKTGPQFVIDTAGNHYSHLGKSYAMAGEYELAMAAFAKAMEIAGPRAEVYASLGGAYGLKGDIPAAISCYEKALELDPAYDRARQMLPKLRKKLR